MHTAIKGNNQFVLYSYEVLVSYEYSIVTPVQI